jgi:hypothetical protein
MSASAKSSVPVFVTMISTWEKSPPSPGNVNQIVARVNPWRSRILRTEATRDHGGQESDTKRSVLNRAHLHHLRREPCAHRSRKLSNGPTAHPSPSPRRAPINTKRGITRDHLRHRRKLSVPSPQRLIHPPSTHPTPSPWRASTAGMKNKDAPGSTMITHIVRDLSTTTLYWYATISIEFALARVPFLYLILNYSTHPRNPNQSVA